MQPRFPAPSTASHGSELYAIHCLALVVLIRTMVMQVCRLHSRDSCPTARKTEFTSKECCLKRTRLGRDANAASPAGNYMLRNAYLAMCSFQCLHLDRRAFPTSTLLHRPTLGELIYCTASSHTCKPSRQYMLSLPPLSIPGLAVSFIRS